MFRLPKVTWLLLLAAIWILSVVLAVKYFGKGLPQTLNIGEGGKLLETRKVVEEESVIIDVVAKVSPSVVSIAVKDRQTFDPFGFSPQQKDEESGIGTGFVVTKEGLILTNKHVVSVENASYIAIIRDNKGQERKFDIREIHRDPFNDLALVKVDANDLIALELGDSNNLKVGQTAIAIGNALGRFENSVTVGIVSGLSRGVAPVDPSTGVAERLDDLVQTDAAINPGNSGGPLVNSAGQVIGINTAVASAENIGFAIKVNVAKQLIGDFQSSGGKISRPFLGIRYTHISRDVALLNEVPEGELVREVVSGSAADRAGIKVGDIMTEFDGQKLTVENELSGLIRAKSVGQEIKVGLFRDKKPLDVTMKLGEAPNQ